MSLAAPPPVQGMDAHGQDTLSHCMKDYKHGPNSRMSITFNSSKGLTNAPGQNNCFLNSAVQVLWHLDAFRRSFRLLSGHSCMGNACIFCALKVMFTQFQYSDKQVLPPDALRQALSETFQNQQRFQMGLMDDAAECFENILTRIHSHIAPTEDEDSCTAAHCIPHRKFSMAVSEQVVCGSCGAKSEPFTFNEMVFYVSTGALVTEFKSHSPEELSGLSFSQLLKSTVSKGDIRACPENCGEFGEKRRDLNNIPDVVSIGLVWESAKSGGQHIRDVVNSIGTTLNLSEMFHSTPCDGTAGGLNNPPPQLLQLVGVVCYYGKHYSTFFFHSKVCEWIYFDDASVKQISPSWSKVCEKLCKGRHQPLLLLYMNTNTEAVDVSIAPKFSTMATGYKWKSEDKNEIINNRSKPPVPEPSSKNSKPSRRAYTPAPDRNDNRYDEIDSAYASRYYYPDKSGRHADRQMSNASSTALSRQDSGVSSHSSRSQCTDGDSVSRISTALTQHSSDSGSSGHQLSRQESDTASSYCSRSSHTSTVSTFSSAVESEDTGYAGGVHASYQHDLSPEPKRDKQKVSLKKKKMKNRLDADVVRYHSKSQASLLDVHNQSYDDSSLTRDKHSDLDADQKSFSYATLPRKKRATPATQQPVTPVRSPEAISVNKKDDGVSESEPAPRQSVNSRIQMFNNINDQSALTKPPSTNNKPPELKPLLHINGNSTEGDSTSYISRSSVEKILYQQRKASSRSAIKMIRPTYEEQFNVPEEFTAANEIGKRHETAAAADSTSISSLKDSGYRSLGDRDSNSASSVSSLSVESPTANHPFNFDNREPIYCEPPPISSEFDSISQDERSGSSNSTGDEFDFPPPPADMLINGNHCKQLSEASILSEASTLKQRKTPSVESLDALPTMPGYAEPFNAAGLDHVLDNIGQLSISDCKLKTMVGSAVDYLNKSMDREDIDDLSNALVFCHQSISLLSSVLNQRPENKQLETLVQSRHEHCLNRAQVLHSRIIAAKERECNMPPDGPTGISTNKARVDRHIMGELHIDNQTKREAASSDYTPLQNAIRRAPTVSRDINASHRLSRTDSTISNGSSGSAGHSVSSTSHVATSSPSCDSTTEKTVHTVPPKLQHSLSQLRQKQQRQQSQSHLLPQHNEQPTHTQQQTRPPQYHTQQSQPYTTQQSKPTYQQQRSLPVPQQPSTPPVHSVQGSSSSNGSGGHQRPDNDGRGPAPKPAVHNLYKDVHIPTTLQRMDYIRDGYRAVPDSRGCSSPSVIPPPKEFQESSPAKHSSSGDSYNLRGVTGYLPVAQQNGAMYGTQTNEYTNSVPQAKDYSKHSHSQLQPASRPRNGADSVIDYREVPLPPKQNINKQNIRELLVQDMLKRKGQHVGTVGLTQEPSRPTNGYQSTNGPHSTSSLYATQFEEPLWTPPQQSAYDRGLSHYDRPNYQRQNLYGQVNSKPTTTSRYYNGNQPQPSLYGEGVTSGKRPASQHNGAMYPECRINHSHTYSTEL